VQIVENWSRIRGRIKSWRPPRKPGESGTLTIAVDDVENVASRDGSHHRNLLADAAGQTVQVIVPPDTARQLRARKGATAVVEVRRGQSPDRVFAHPERITLTP
jgi:hypothetical protein